MMELATKTMTAESRIGSQSAREGPSRESPLDAKAIFEERLLWLGGAVKEAAVAGAGSCR